MKQQEIKIAILDMYDGAANEGMRCIHEIIDRHDWPSTSTIKKEVFDVRGKNQIPDLNYDIYISSGGPGNPLPVGLSWEKGYYSLMDSLLEYNQGIREEKKYVFFICHSFQVICDHLKIATVCKRRSPAYGIFPVHHTATGAHDDILKKLPDPFYAVDSRDYQVIEPDEKVISKLGANILCIEKERLHVPLQRAIMAVRISNEFFGVQFHPEADAPGMMKYFARAEKKKSILETHGEEKYKEMISYLSDPKKIQLTQSLVIPSFLNLALHSQPV